MTEEERANASENVKNLCNNKSILKVEMTEVSKEQYEENMTNAGDCCQAGGRREHQHTLAKTVRL